MSETEKKRRDLDPVRAVKEVKQMLFIGAFVLGLLPFVLPYFLKVVPFIVVPAGLIWLGRVIKNRTTRL